MAQNIESGAKSPLEVVMKNTPSQMVQFLDGSTVIRNILNARNNDGRIAIAPLRGAMPFVWSSKGVTGIEQDISVQEVPVPLGTYQNVSGEGEFRATSPTYEQKIGILKDVFNTFSDEELERVLVLEEVQKGGTLPDVIEIINKIVRKRRSEFALGIIAVQDSRQRVVRQAKTDRYEKIASNSFSPHVITNVVPMPLIATDRAPLLDSITLTGNRHDRYLSLDRFTVNRNERAEVLLRGLGTAARQADIRHDDTFMSNLVNTQGGLSELAAGRLEVWLPQLIAKLDHRSVRE